MCLCYLLAQFALLTAPGSTTTLLWYVHYFLDKFQQPIPGRELSMPCIYSLYICTFWDNLSMRRKYIYLYYGCTSLLPMPLWLVWKCTRAISILQWHEWFAVYILFYVLKITVICHSAKCLSVFNFRRFMLLPCAMTYQVHACLLPYLHKRWQPPIGHQPR